MATEPEGQPERVDRVERKVDRLSASVESRFDAVDHAFLEQRQYTEFAFDQVRAEMRSEMRAGFGEVDARFDRMDAKFDAMDAHFSRLERKFDQLIDRLDIDKP